MTSVLLVVGLMMISGAASAAEPGHHGVPWKTIGWQVLNLGILVVGLVYLLKDSTRQFFAARRTGFIDAAKKSQSAREEAEKQYKEIQAKIEHLEATRAESIARAEAEAAELKKTLTREAEELAARIRKEAEATARAEVMKAKKDLHEQFVQEAIASARAVLTKDIGAADQQKLQADFMKNVEAVRP